MKTFFFPVLIICTMFVLTGCPAGLDFPLGTPGTEKINKDMIGTWTQTDVSREITKMQITKIDDYRVKVEVLQKGELYSDEDVTFTGWFTELDGKQFIYVRAEDSYEADYYTYCYEVKNKTLTSWDINLLVGGSDAVTSTNALRLEVSKSLKMDGALTSETVWSKE